MASETHVPGYVPNSNYSQEDWDDVHSPELTDEQLAQGRPVAEVWPELVNAVRKRRGAQRTPTKAQLTLRLDREVIDGFKATGPGWQSRMNDALRAMAADIKANPGVDAFDIVPGKSMRAKEAEEAEADRRRGIQADHVSRAVQDLAQRVEDGRATKAEAARVLALVEDLRGLPEADFNLLADVIDQARA